MHISVYKHNDVIMHSGDEDSKSSIFRNGVFFFFLTIDNHMFMMSMMSDGRKLNTCKTVLFSRV